MSDPMHDVDLRQRHAEPVHAGGPLGARLQQDTWPVERLARGDAPRTVAELARTG